MLGQREHTTPLNSEESRRVREIAYRVATGNLNDDDRKVVAYFDNLKVNNKNRFIWK